jgi:hypothetical protein
MYGEACTMHDANNNSIQNAGKKTSDLGTTLEA